METRRKPTDPNSCKARIGAQLKSRLEDLRKFFPENGEWPDEVEDIGSWHEYGLAFDYVAPGTFQGQREGYWRYQLSWGGPSDEFRFYSSSPDAKPYRIAYHFMDWFDGARRILRGTNEELLLTIWDEFEGMGMTTDTYEKAIAS